MIKRIRSISCVVLIAIMMAWPVMADSAASCYASDDAAKVCSSAEEAGEALRDAMKKRAETVDLRLVSDDAEQAADSESDAEDLMNKIFDKAVEHTGDPCEGDYLKYHYYKWEASAESVWENGEKRITLKYTISYLDTAEQQEELDEIVAGIISDLDLEEKTDYEKVECIYDYLCDNVEYDSENLENDDYKLKYTAYAALADGKAVCQGYAEALYRLLLEAGIDNRIITGTGISDLGENDRHAWNIVRLGDVYYNADVTNDSELLRKRYFLKGTGSFNDDHIRAEEYDSEEFHSRYPMGEKDCRDPDSILNRLAALLKQWGLSPRGL